MDEEEYEDEDGTCLGLGGAKPRPVGLGGAQPRPALDLAGGQVAPADDDDDELQKLRDAHTRTLLEKMDAAGRRAAVVYPKRAKPNPSFPFCKDSAASEYTVEREMFKRQCRQLKSEIKRLEHETPKQREDRHLKSDAVLDRAENEAWRVKVHPYPWDGMGDDERDAYLLTHRYMIRGSQTRPADGELKRTGGVYWRCVALAEDLTFTAQGLGGRGSAHVNKTKTTNKQHPPPSANYSASLVEVVNKLASDGPGGKIIAPGGFFGWWRKKYEKIDHFVLDVRNVFFLEMTSCANAQLAKQQLSKFDRELALLERDEFAAILQPLEFHVTRLVQDMANHPCSVAYRRINLQPAGAVVDDDKEETAMSIAYRHSAAASPSNFTNELLSLEDVEARLAAGYYGGEARAALEKLELDLRILNGAAVNWYGTTSNVSFARVVPHATLLEFSDALARIFLFGWPPSHGQSAVRSRIHLLNEAVAADS